MKIIDVPKSSRQVTLNDRSSRSGTRNATTTSSALRVVERKTARRPVSGRNGSTRVTDTEKVRTSINNASDSLRTGKSKSARDGNTAIVAATELSGRQADFRQRRRAESSIIVNGDNNVIVQGDITASNPRPRIETRRLRHDVSRIRHHSHWRSHSGYYFSFSWSGSSCGRVAYLPYRYRHSWCRYPISYNPCYGLSYYYPRYHRKYIYVSLGGYWPSWYRHRRYYWYGCHPYYWYGTNVISEPYQDVTYNTYNYYTNENGVSDYSLSDNPQSVYTTEDILDEPEFESAADLCFSRAVELFESENYADAALQFREAISLSPDDIVLPFTYSQALFANGDYAHAASVLREAIRKIPEEELTVYYPRGLYQDEQTLTEQISLLEIAAAGEPFDADYQLLLGYQYLGIGQLDKAYPPLTEAAGSPANAATAGKLLELAAKLEEETVEN
jgi:tetratricopeptide (TPR) repeat protein